MVPFAPHQSSRPLTLEEINGLKVNTFMPVLMIAGMALVTVIIAAFIVVPMWNAPFIRWFAGAAMLLLIAVSVFVWMHVRNNMGDLRDGVAQVRTGRLISKRRTYGDAPYTHYATIEGAGEVIVWGVIGTR